MTEYSSEKIAKIHRELHSHLPSEPALRTKALENLLVEKGLLNPDAVDAWIEVYSERIGPKRGAQVVARAWVDAAYKERLLADATKAIASSASPGVRRAICRLWRIPRACTTSSFARSAPAIPYRFLACHPPGISRMSTERALCAIPVACSRNSVSRYLTSTCLNLKSLNECN